MSNKNLDRFLKPYRAQDVETKIYQQWLDSGFFNPDNLPKADQRQPFTIIMPPPNANGHLHAGHALFITLEDIIIRYQRMRGKKTLWLPGADHAGFETQVVFEKKLEKEGRSRFDFPADELYQAILTFTKENKQFMEQELRAMGASCDWSRQKFTLDDEIVKTVYDTFRQLFADGLIYRGKRIVNWCTKHQTSLSDLETTSETRTDKLYYLRYGPLVVATVRPETMFGDVAIAVNPTDQRYQQYIGQQISVQTPIGEMSLPVIADQAVEIAFGTGALKITPAHDPNDFDIALRHQLPSKEVIDQHGRLNQLTGKYAGLKVAEARPQVVADLQALGLLLKEEPYEHNVLVCYKCQRILEPRIIPQWFVKTNSLADRASQAVTTGQLRIIPDWQEKIYLTWLKNIRDWNISRQIAWGIKIPAKICPRCDFGTAELKTTTCPQCHSQLIDDQDTFDTWFSSGQWPFATLGYPDKPDYHNYYPTDVMETGSDILFFWVARMMMLGLYRTGRPPFHTVYLHGLVRDGRNQKMSKSKGNVISPVAIGEKFGTDALRMALVVGNTPGTDLALAENKIKAYQHFANKLWNIARFILQSLDSANWPKSSQLTDEDLSIKKQFAHLAIAVSEDLDQFRFHVASEKIYHYVWHELADKIIEDSKAIINNQADEVRRLSRLRLLQDLLTDSLKLLHPFMPFITEEIWSALPETDSLLVVAPWPEFKSQLHDGIIQ